MPLLLLGPRLGRGMSALIFLCLFSKLIVLTLGGQRCKLMVWNLASIVIKAIVVRIMQICRTVQRGKHEKAAVLCQARYISKTFPNSTNSHSLLKLYQTLLPKCFHFPFIVAMRFERNDHPLKEMLPKCTNTFVHISAFHNVLFRDWSQRASDTVKLKNWGNRKLSFSARCSMRKLVLVSFHDLVLIEKSAKATKLGLEIDDVIDKLFDPVLLETFLESMACLY